VEPTLEETLKKDIEAHKAGEVQEADKLSESSTNPQDPPSDQLQSIINLYTQGQLQQALSDASQMLEKFPNSAVLYNITGASNAGLMQFETAIDNYKQSLKIKPDYAKAYNNMAIALNAKGDSEAAVDSCKQALKLEPDYADAYNNMGIALNDKGDPEAAIDSYKQAIRIKPHDAEVYNNMGVALVEKGELNAGIKSYEMALGIKPDYQDALVNKLKQQSRICDWTALKEDQNLIAKLGISTESLSPLSILPLEDSPKRHRVRSEILTKKLHGYKTPLPPAAKPSQKPQRLRIGYFSADFCEHPVAYLMAKVLETHDRKRFEVYGYSIGPAKDDDMRQRLIEAFDVFIDVHNMTDLDVALLARQDKIDIAIDLTGYTKYHRAGIFAYRAASVQINYLGYPGTMGADFIDYIIADQNLIPMDSQKFYSEKPIYLPHHYQAQDNTLSISNDTPSRLDLGLPDKGFIFCAINNSYKIRMPEFDVWMRLLSHVDGSVLWLLESNKFVKDNLLKEAQARGISAERLVFAQGVSHETYLAQFRRADLYLDTFNYNAGATASNALWAGLPVLTKLGRGYTARMAGSLLTSIGLPELATHSEEDYESLALALATDPERLAKIRQTLADNRLSTPLFDTALFTKHLENGFEQVYQRYYDGKPPDDIFVPEHC
jgi:predicted O-linked N-acetylglucosamine transferase (SPINDLY family)